MLDKEDEEDVVDDNFENFRLLYDQIVNEKFKEHMEIRDGKFYIDEKDVASRKLLAMQINDNTYKNLKTFSPLLFDENQRYSKE